MPHADHPPIMSRAAAFEAHHRRYDEWFERHTAAYYSELLAVRALLPWRGLGLSVGVGTGRFASPLGVQIGIDPADGVLSYAARRGVSALGIYTIRRFADWGRRYNIYLVCFAAGVLIAVSFLHIIPKSFEMSANAPAYLLTGFVLLHLFNRFITAFVCE